MNPDSKLKPTTWGINSIPGLTTPSSENMYYNSSTGTIYILQVHDPYRGGLSIWFRYVVIALHVGVWVIRTARGLYRGERGESYF